MCICSVIQRMQQMHPKNTKHTFIYLGPHDQIIEVGDEKHMVLQEGGDVPFWVAPQECVSKECVQYD